jgi:hypothetical protein
MPCVSDIGPNGSRLCGGEPWRSGVCEYRAIRSSPNLLRNLAGKNQPSSRPAPKRTSARVAFAASNGEPLPCSQPRLCVAFGSQLPADPGEPKIRSTAFNRSRQAATDASTGSWAAALAAARHTWAEWRCRLQLSEPFMNQHTHLLAAVVVAAADASPCGPQLALHASAPHVLSLLRQPPARLCLAPTPSSPAPAPVRSVRLCSPQSSREPPAFRLDPRLSRRLRRRAMPSAHRSLTGPFAPSR